MYGDPLTPLERDVISALVSGAGPVMDGFRAQLAVCRIKSRRFTGVGFFTDIVVPRQLAVPGIGRRVLSDPKVHGELDGLEHGAGFVLFVEDGMIATLEGFSYGDDTWPDSIGSYTIKPSR